MNAVNLIPRDARARRSASTASPATLGLIGGLVLVLVAVVLYVSASNDVTQRRDTLTRLSAATSSWTAAAGQFAPFVKAAEDHAQQVAGVRQLAGERFPWSQLLSQIGGVMPAGTGLTSMQATTAGGAASSTGASSAATVPGVQLSGCAQSQSAVAQTMVALHEVTGVTDVTLSSSTDGGSASAASSSSSGGGSGGCRYPVQFAITLTFASPSASTPGAATSPASGATASTAPSTTSTTSTTSSPATTAAAPATSGSTASTASVQ